MGGYIDKMLNERLLSVLSTKENVNLATLGFAEENVKKYQAIIAPIDIAGERLGTLFLYKANEQYDIDDIILCEYGTTVVGLEMMRSVNEETAAAKAAAVTAILMLIFIPFIRLRSKYRCFCGILFGYAHFRTVLCLYGNKLRLFHRHRWAFTARTSSPSSG